MTLHSLNSQFEELVKAALDKKQQMEQSDDTPKMIGESAKSQDFFQSNKDKIERKYATTRVKLRNVLSNMQKVGINREKF